MYIFIYSVYMLHNQCLWRGLSSPRGSRIIECQLPTARYSRENLPEGLGGGMWPILWKVVCDGPGGRTKGDPLTIGVRGGFRDNWQLIPVRCLLLSRQTYSVENPWYSVKSPGIHLLPSCPINSWEQSRPAVVPCTSSFIWESKRRHQ